MADKPSSGSGRATGDEAPKSAASKLFDIRLLIGGLFVLYGLMLTIAGFFTSQANKAKAAGININLWLGVAMLVLGIFFLVWQRLNPLKIEANPTHDPLEDVHE